MTDGETEHRWGLRGTQLKKGLCFSKALGLTVRSSERPHTGQTGVGSGAEGKCKELLNI
jgi:hypothetical protein